MELKKESNSAQYQITKYSATSITVNDQEYDSSILIAPNHLAQWPVRDIQLLSADDLQSILNLQQEIVLIGTGSKLVFPDLSIIQVLYAPKIGLEVMTTPAACRTYAALTSEGRNVLAALIV